MRVKVSSFLFFTVLYFAVSCKTAHNKSEIESAMQRYNYFIQKVNADSIALLFMPEGNLGTVAHGQEAIRKFLLQYKDINVVSQVSTTNSIIIAGDSAVQKGAYKQTDILPAHTDTLKVSGTFTAKWQWDKQHKWRIQSMETKN